MSTRGTANFSDRRCRPRNDPDRPLQGLLSTACDRAEKKDIPGRMRAINPTAAFGRKLIQVIANRLAPNYNGNRNPLPRLDFAPMIGDLAWYVHPFGGYCGLTAERRIAGGRSLDKSRRNKGSLQLKLPERRKEMRS
jgi:hypothetical protein